MSKTIDTFSATRSATKTIPSIGLMKTFRGKKERDDVLAVHRQACEKHGNVVSNRSNLFKVVYMFGPDANRLVLLDKDRIFSARRPWMMIMGRVFPNGLLLMDGDEHKLHRKIMNGAFMSPALRQYAERMNPLVAKSTAAWSTHAGRPDSASPDQDRASSTGRFHVFPAIKELTLDMASRIFLGLELGSDAREMNRAFSDMVASTASLVRLPIPGLEFNRGLKAREFMVKFLGDRIARKRASDDTDMFARLCHVKSEEGEHFSDQQVIDHMSLLMMAAHDTTTSTLTSMFYQLAKHPEWQDRARKECIDYGKEDLDFDDLEHFQALGLIFRETLRLHPPLPLIPRVATESFEFEDYLIPKNSMVAISPIHTHHSARWWDDPTRFDPERFGPQRAEHKRHSHSWIPFGGGPHMCIGFRFAEIQVKVIMHHVLRRYRLSVPADYEMPIQQSPIGKPTDGLPMDLQPLGN